MNDEFISPFKVTKKFDISSNTLREWAESGKISCIRTNNGKGKRLYNIKEIYKILGYENTIPILNPITLCYARVSSNHQKEDLNRQIEFLKQSYPNTEIITDIGSGLNYKRTGFQTLLERVYKGNVKEVVVTYKDRLCRFGFELVEWVFKQTNTKIVVLNGNSETDFLSTKELSDDLLSIITVFVAKNNGLRSAEYKKQRKIKQLETDKSKESSEEKVGQ
jgi:putative resolvase